MLKEDKLLKNFNVNRILDLVRRTGGISRADLSKKLKLTPASISKISKKLIDAGYIAESGLKESIGGRPAKILELKGDLANIISIYMAPDYISAVLYNLDMREIYREDYKYRILSKETVLNKVFELIEILLKKSDSEVLGIGLAINGLVDGNRGISIYSPHYNWFDVELKKIIEEKFDIETYIENDVRAMAIGEKNYGSAKDIENFIVVNIENGVGSGIYINDRIYYGAGYGAGEFGHIPIEGNRLVCSCGKIGCLETLITNENLEKEYFFKTGIKLSAKAIYSLCAGGDEIAGILVENIAKNLAKGLLTIVDILNPRLLIIVGEINICRPFVYEIIKKELDAKSFGNLNKVLEIKASSFDHDSANIGAASLIIEKIFRIRE